ncbi:MAG: 50S ribosomal protein L30 [Anaerolineae bacterium]
MAKQLVIRYVKSAIGYSVNQKRTIVALGFHRMGDVVVQEDNPVIRGMVHNVQHLVHVEEVES